MHIGNQSEENIYIKSDGSLNNGMEIVTHPMSLNYHKTKMPWEEVMRRVVKLDYRSHEKEFVREHSELIELEERHSKAAEDFISKIGRRGR